MKKQIQYIAILSVVVLTFFSFFYGKVLLHPNSYLFNTYGDGIKTYYTYAFHIKNDSSYAAFNGMNYPYTETIFFAGTQPALSTFIKLISEVFPSIADYSIGIMNWLMIISLLFCSIFLFLIFQKLGVSGWYAIAAALAVTALSPQTFRYWGHYDLSYHFFFPLSWYLVIRLYDSIKKFKWVMLFFLNNLFWLFIHPYLGMISVMFSLTYWLVDFILNFRKRRKNYIQYLYLFIHTMLPLLLLNIVSTAVDNHIDRTNNPVGFFLYTTNLKSIFTPYTVGGMRGFYNLFVTGGKFSEEGIAYIGFIPNLIIVITFVLLIIRVIKRKKQYDKMPLFNQTITLSIISAILLLLFAMAYPFKWNLSILLDWFPFLKQFRALGRFAWVFYFVIGVFTFYFIYNTFTFLIKKYSSKKYLFYSVLFIAPAFSVYEGTIYHSKFETEITRSPNLFDKEQLPESYINAIKKINPEKYQAIIPMPFYLTGPENYQIDNCSEVKINSKILSYHLNKPIATVSLSRTSMSEGRKLVQIVTPNYYKETYKDDITDNRPFLIVNSNEKMNQYEKKMIDKSILIYESELFRLYELSYEKLFQDETADVVNAFNRDLQKLTYKNDMIVTDSTAFVYFDNFNTQKSDVCYYGKGAFKNAKWEYNYFYKVNSNILNLDKDYDVSMWYYNNGDRINHVMAIAEEHFIDEHKANWNYLTDPRFSYVVNEYWSLVEWTFKPVKPNTEYTIMTKAIDKNNDTIRIDNLLIRPVDVNVYKVLFADKDSVDIMFNNQVFSLDRKTAEPILIKFLMEKIKKDKSWFEAVNLKAQQQNVPLDEMIWRDAKYMAERMTIN